MGKKCFLLLVAAALIFWGPRFCPAGSAEYITDENIAPDTIDDIKSPLSKSFEEEKHYPGLFPRLKRAMEKADPFIRDTKLNLHLRSYYFDRDRDDLARNQAWALGGWLKYKSGWFKNAIRIGATVQTTQPLWAPTDTDATQLLSPDGGGITVLGELYLKAKLVEGTEIRLFRQSLNLPYINKNDSRMIPNTFEAYGLFSQTNPYLHFAAAHVPRMKTRNSDSFVSMSEAAGFSGTDEPVSFGGAMLRFNDQIYIGGLNVYSWNYMNTAYAESSLGWKFNDKYGLMLMGQYTDQRDVGDAMGGEFQNWSAGGRLTLNIHGLTINGAYTTTGESATLHNPYGGYPGFTSLMASDFNRPGEKAWLIGASFSCKRLGLPGLGMIVNYAHGYAPNNGPAAAPNQEELDLTVDYHRRSGWLQGAWLRFRAAWLKQDQDYADARNAFQIRVILNYDFDLL